jgi:hypothetical protein
MKAIIYFFLQLRNLVYTANTIKGLSEKDILKNITIAFSLYFFFTGAVFASLLLVLNKKYFHYDFYNTHIIVKLIAGFVFYFPSFLIGKWFLNKLDYTYPYTILSTKEISRWNWVSMITVLLNIVGAIIMAFVAGGLVKFLP